jgi:hypothetical protein
MSYKFSKKKFRKVASIKNFDVLFCAYRFVNGMFGLQIELFFNFW